jgi:hypothetical protein
MMLIHALSGDGFNKSAEWLGHSKPTGQTEWSLQSPETWLVEPDHPPGWDGKETMQGK